MALWRTNVSELRRIRITRFWIPSAKNFRRPDQTYCHHLRCIFTDGVSVSNVSRVDTERLGENARCRCGSPRFALQSNRAAGRSTTHLDMWP